MDLEKESGCKAYYLLYSGKRNYFTKGLKDICGKPFKTAHFGCSLVEPNFVKEQVALGRKSFEDFHNTPAQPWHILAGCPMILFKSTPKYYSLRSIMQAAKNKNYEQIFKTGIELNYESIETSTDNLITDSLETAERATSYMVVLPLNNT